MKLPVQLAQAPAELSDLQSFGSYLKPISWDKGAVFGDYPLVGAVWNIVAALFEVAIFGFLLALVIGGLYYLFSLGNDETTAKAKRSFLNASIGLVVVFGAYTILTYIIRQFGSDIQSGDFARLTAGIYELALATAGAGFLIVLLTGGLRYMTAAGSEEAAAKAKKQLSSGLVGVILVGAAFAIGRAVLKLLQII